MYEWMVEMSGVELCWKGVLKSRIFVRCLTTPGVRLWLGVSSFPTCDVIRLDSCSRGKEWKDWIVQKTFKVDRISCQSGCLRCVTGEAV